MLRLRTVLRHTAGLLAAAGLLGVYLGMMVLVRALGFDTDDDFPLLLAAVGCGVFFAAGAAAWSSTLRAVRGESVLEVTGPVVPGGVATAVLVLAPRRRLSLLAEGCHVAVLRTRGSGRALEETRPVTLPLELPPVLEGASTHHLSIPLPAELPQSEEPAPLLSLRRPWETVLEVHVTPRWLPTIRLRAPLEVRAAPGASAAGP